MMLDSTNDMEHELEVVSEDERLADEELVADQALVAPDGPMTRSRVKLFNQAIRGMLNNIWADQIT